MSELERTHYEQLERVGKASWWMVGIALLVVLAFALLARFGAFIIPALIGMVLATTLNPIVNWLARRHVPRIAAAALLSLFVVVVLIIVAWGIVAIVVNQSPQIWGTTKTGLAQVDTWLGRLGAAHGTVDRLRTVATALQSGAAHGVLPLALRGVRELYYLVVAIFLASGFSFFFLWEGPDVRRWVARHLLLPEKVGMDITASLVRTTRRYVAGLSCIGVCQGIIVGATAAIAGVNSWPVIAFAIFLGNYIPYIGGIVAGIFAVLLTLGSEGPGAALAVLIAIVIAYFAGSHLGVFFIGGAIRLPVTAVFVLTMTGAAVAGVFGAAATAPLTRLILDAREIVAAHRAEELEAQEAAARAAGEVDELGVPLRPDCD